MSAAFIGCKISLISKSEIRYEGILYTIDTKESTIALAKVRSFGTEDRQTDKPVAPRSEVYEYIIFRASDIKDLIVDDPPAAGPGLSDPAIIQAQSVGSSAPSTTFSAAPGSGGMMTTVTAASGLPGSKTTLANVMSGNNQQAGQALTAISGQAGFQISRGSTPTNQRKSPLHEPKHHQERRSNNAGGQQNREQRDNQRGTQHFSRGGGGGQRRDGYGQQHVQQQQQMQIRAPRGGQHTSPQGPRQPMPQQGFNRGGRGGPQGYIQNYGHQRPPNVGGRPQGQNRPPNQQWQNRGPAGQYNRSSQPRGVDVTKLDEYDFEKANQEFTELESKFAELGTDDVVKPDEEQEQQEEPKAGDANDDDEQHYDKKKSFFDSISCEAIERSKGNVQRIDRRQERKLNEETFGVGGIRHNYRGRGGYRGYNNRGGGYGGQNRNFQRGGYARRGQGDRQFNNGPSENRQPQAQQS